MVFYKLPLMSRKDYRRIIKNKVFYENNIPMNKRIKIKKTLLKKQGFIDDIGTTIQFG